MTTTDKPKPHGETDGRILDALTGVYSIEYFEHQMRSEVAFTLRHELQLSLVLVAVDYLDDLIESFGVDARDHTIVCVADVVREHVRTEDVLARYGVAQFAVLARGTELEPAIFLARRVRQSVESAPLSYKGMELPITVSVGVATLGSDTEQHVSVVESAEEALAKARATGNCVVVAGT